MLRYGIQVIEAVSLLITTAKVTFFIIFLIFNVTPTDLVLTPTTVHDLLVIFLAGGQVAIRSSTFVKPTSAFDLTTMECTLTPKTTSKQIGELALLGSLSPYVNYLKHRLKEVVLAEGRLSGRVLIKHGKGTAVMNR